MRTDPSSVAPSGKFHPIQNHDLAVGRLVDDLIESIAIV